MLPRAVGPAILLCLAPWLSLAFSDKAEAPARGAEEEFKSYTEHPRLLLNARRLRLLRRERERRSPRWEQFAGLVAGKAKLPEFGFAAALYYQVSGDAESGREAVGWALGAGADLRQAALVFDWCQGVLTPEQSKALADKLVRGIQAPAADDAVSDTRSRAFAAIALSDHVPQAPETELARIVQKWWRGGVVPALKAGMPALSRDDNYALFEMLHAVRENLNIDLTDDCRAFINRLPAAQLLSYYPAVYPAPENDYRIPAVKGAQPDLVKAVMSRAAEMAMVAYEPNTEAYQFLQGWVMHDRFMMRGPLGAPYEFLWGNPYQPGLTYYNLPLAHHDGALGQLFLRSSWDDGAEWLAYFQGELQTFQNGRPVTLALESLKAPMHLMNYMAISGRGPLRFRVDFQEAGAAYILGLKPKRRYEIEVDDEEMREARSDAGGILALEFVAATRAGVRVREVANQGGAGR